MSLRSGDRKSGIVNRREEQVAPGGIAGLAPSQQEVIALHEKLEGRGNPSEKGLSDRPPYDKGAIIIVNGKPAWYIHDKLKRETIVNGNTTPFIQKREFGAILYFDAHFDSKNDGVFVDLMGRNNSKITLNDMLVKDMVQAGRGLTPGMVKTLPDGTSPDPMGTPDPVVPWVAKYKDTTEADGIGNTGRGFVIRYTPRHPIEYKNIRLTFRNQSGFDSLLIRAEIIRAQFLDENELSHYGYDRI